MRHRDYFQRIGLPVILLAAGMLGGLLAPNVSQAGTPTLTLEVDPDPDGAGPLTRGGNGPQDFLGAQVSSCTLTETNAGWTACYPVSTTASATGTNGHIFKAASADGNVSPRLLISDKTSGDGARLTGVKFLPTTNFSVTQIHYLRVVITNTFDAAPNTQTTASIGVRTGGLFVAGPSPISPYVTKNNKVTYAGFAKFQGPTGPETALLNDSNPAPLTFQEGSSVTKSYYTLDQITTFPNFACDSNGSLAGTTCMPIVRLVYDVTLYGPDSFVLTDSQTYKHVGCEKFSEHPKAGDKNAVPCHKADTSKRNPTSADDILTSDFATETNTEIDSMGPNGLGGVKGLTCAEAQVRCPCADLGCTGDIIHVVKIQSDGAGQTFKFLGTGPGMPKLANLPDGVYSITPTVTPNGVIGTYSHLNLPTLGNQWSMATFEFPLHPDPAKFYWDVDTISCVSEKEGTYDDLQTKLYNGFEVFTNWTQPSGEPKTRHDVLLLDGGDTLTCTWSIHSKSVNSSGAPP